MPLYEIAGPDGKIYEIEGPAGATREEVIAAIQARLASRPTTPTPEPTIGGQIKEGFKGLVPGAIGLLETAGAGAAALLPEEYETGARETISRVAAAAKKPFEAAPGYEDTVGRKLGEAVGSTAPFLVAGPFGLAGRAAAVGLGTAAGAGEARTRAEREGATAEERAAATGFGIIPGAAEAFAPLRILGRLGDDIVGGGVAYVKRALVAGGEEAAQEAASAYAQNLIAKGIYKPEQELIEGLGEQAAYGGATGAIVQGLLDMAIGRRARGAAASAETPAEGPAGIPTTATQQELFTKEQAPYAETDDESVFAMRQAQMLEEGTRQENLVRLDSLRNEFDTLQRENERLRVQFEAAPTDEAKAAIKAQADRIAPALAELNTEIQKVSKKLGAAEAARAEPARLVGADGQLGLDFEAPAMERRKTPEGQVLGETTPAPGMTAEQADFFQKNKITALQQKLDAGELLTPADLRLLQEAKTTEQAAFEAAPTPDLFAPEAKAEGRPQFELAPSNQPQYVRDAAGRVQRTVPPEEPTTPTPEVRTITEADFKLMGIAPSNKKLREAIIGKDITKPKQRQFVREQLEQYAGAPNRSARIADAVSEFLSTGPFMEQTTFDFMQKKGAPDVTTPGEPVAGAVEPSVPVSKQRRAKAAPRTEAPVTEGLGDIGAGARQVAAGTTAQPSALDEATKRGLDKFAAQLQAEPGASDLNRRLAYLPTDQQRYVRSKLGGLKAKYRTAKKGQKGNPKGAVERYVRELMQGWVNAPETKVVQSITELPDYMQEQIRADGVNPKGAFDPRTETVYVVADNIVGRTDLIMTVAHEAIGHYGLRSVLGGNYSRVLNNLYQTNDQVRAKADQKIADGLDKDTAIEEVLAEAVEERVPADTLMGKAVQKLKNIMRAVMRKLGVSTINDKQVQELLDSFSNYVVQGKGTRGEGVAGAREGIFRGEELVIKRGEAAWTPQRIKNLLSTWAYGREDADTKAYAGFVNPNDFLQATSTAEYRESRLEKENRPLDLQGLADETQPIFLQLELGKINTESAARIIGHEGRHRMMALRDAGVTKVPVVFLNGYAGQRVSDAKPVPRLTVLKEDIGERGFVVQDLTPISYAYKDQVQQKFGSPDAQVVFRRGKKPELTAEGKRAEAAVAAMGNISNTKPKVPEKSLLGKATAFAIDPSYRQEQIDRLRVQVAYKGASVERKLMDAFNGKVRDALGNIRPDLFMTAAEHSDTMTVAAMKQGTLYLNKDIGWDVKKGPNTLQGSMETVRKLGEKLGSQELAFKLANDAFIARRANALKNHPNKDVFALPSQDKIDAGLKAFKDFPELEQAFKEYTEFKNGQIDAMVQGGRLSPEQAKVWKDAIDYVPWNRIKEYEESAQTSPKGYFKGLVNLGQMGKLKGSDDEINNVFDNMVGLSFWMTNSAIRNHAALNLVDTFNRLNLGIRPVREGQAGVDPNKVIFVYRDGKPEAYELDSIADVYAFKGVESLSMPMLKSLAAFANFLRKATTATPQFAVSQLFQDSYRATVMSGTRSPFKTAASVLAGYKDAYFGDETTRRLEQLGIVGMYDLMPGRVKEDIEKEFGLKQRGTVERAVNFMESFSIASDAALRKSVYERTLAETKSEQFPEGDVLLARYRAQEIINFKRQGANRAVGLFRQIIPFMNAYIQGMDVFYRSMTGRGVAADERAAAAKLFWRTGAKLAALSTIYAMMAGDDEEYEGLRDFEKDKNFIIPGTGMKIPVAPEVGFLFKVLPERTYNYIISQGTERPQDATALRKAIATAGFDAITGPNLTPQFIKPLIEVSLNQSFFTNTPIVGRGLEQREASEQFTANTSELAKMFGQLTGLSPMKVEYVFRGYTGIAGGSLLDFTNMMFANRPDRRIYEMPGFKTFMYDKVPGGYKEQYYDLRDRVTEVNATINGFKADGRVDELYEYLTDEKLNKYALVKTINKIDQQLEDFRALRKVVSSDPTMSGEEKRRVIDEIDASENELLQYYNIPQMRKEIAGL